MFRALLFDFDGLILDTESIRFASWQHVFDRHGCELTPDVWHDCLGRPTHLFDPRELLKELASSDVDVPTARAMKRSREIELIEKTPLQRGVTELIQSAAEEKIELAVVSSSTRNWVCGNLERLDLTKYFSCIICAEDVQSHKPDPAPYRAALNKLEVAASDAVALEDSPHGIFAAIAAGVFCVAASNPITCKLDLSKANLRVSSLAEVSVQMLRDCLKHVASKNNPFR
jgi:HAD superfamily hydrolase (TIGR01509 family)